MDVKESHDEPSPASAASECLRQDEMCPLCGGDNCCRVAKGNLYKGACWCHEVIVPGHILKRLCVDSVEPTCLCRSCLETVARIAREIDGTDAILAEAQRVIGENVSNFYLDAKGNMVFTTAYHLKRGSCCNNGCRHCPY